MRHDIQLHTAVNPSDMEGGIGNVIIIIARPIFTQFVLRCANLAGQIAGKMQRIDRQWCQRRMAGTAMALRPDRCLALMAGAKSHFGWLTNDAHGGSERGFRHHLDYRAHADTTDLLVIGQRQMQRRAEWQFAGGDKAGDRCGAKAFHICRAAPIKPTILLGAGKGWPRPVLSIDRHDISVAGQHHAAIIRPVLTRANWTRANWTRTNWTRTNWTRTNWTRACWADAGKQIGLLVALIGNHRRADPGIIKPVGNIINQRPVRIAADCGKADQIMKYLNCLGHHIPLCQRLRC